MYPKRVIDGGQVGESWHPGGIWDASVSYLPLWRHKVIGFANSTFRDISEFVRVLLGISAFFVGQSAGLLDQSDAAESQFHRNVLQKHIVNLIQSYEEEETILKEDKSSKELQPPEQIRSRLFRNQGDWTFILPRIQPGFLVRSSPLVVAANVSFAAHYNWSVKKNETE
ncbi:hypothetical protein BD410DRAFT_800745 [Rickenella mellea]|uniref:Uncharacterized protein n=1 Tax=Rickenella mellea TaxID=50990 RepID=A0A4Y7QEQ9_9AGAM|nr:hypothetical protein BD410DRAFT_800745 [Rickenella mellea]